MFVMFALAAEETQSRNARVEKLLAGISCGNTATMGLLYDLIKTDIFAYALSKTGNKADAEDIMQDTFVQIYKNAKQYTPKGKPMAWIFTIETNLINRQYQIKSRTASLDESFENVSSDEDVQEKLINNAFLVQLLKNLNEEERQVIALHIVSGLKHREIAKVLGKPLSTVLSKYNRAIKKLQLAAKEG